jgi:hypothetical protein
MRIHQRGLFAMAAGWDDSLGAGAGESVVAAPAVDVADVAAIATSGRAWDWL